MTQTRWVLLEVTLSDGECEQANLVDGGVDNYIVNEIQWLAKSFDTVSIIEITSELDHNVFEE